MADRFKVHYTPAQARRLLPRLRQWLEEMEVLASELVTLDKYISGLLEQGRDAGGSEVGRRIRSITRLNRILAEFSQREIQIKDLHRGLLDIPSRINGQEAFLCWEKSEADLSHWHPLEAGYAGRQPLPE